MNTRYIFVFLFAFIILSHSFNASAQDEKQFEPILVGFYNLENLFDTIQDTTKFDTEFIPDGKNLWNSEKYKHKISQMSKVIADIGLDYSPDGVAVLGISEIENRHVIEDLTMSVQLKDKGYDIVHYNSPDRRGVDVGLMYQTKYFSVTNSASYRLYIDGWDNFASRDQLVVSGRLLGEEMHFIVNHWPSRRGGEKKSRPLRNAAAELSRHIVDSLLTLNPEAKIIVMGDLNDNPNNQSVKEIMRAKGDQEKLEEGDFFNPMYKMYKKGIGSNAWRDTWSLFDQILLSQGFLGNDYATFKLYKTHVFNKGYLQQKDGRYKGYPSRTFAGGTWQAGYSDHFPVYVVLIREKK